MTPSSLIEDCLVRWRQAWSEERRVLCAEDLVPADSPPELLLQLKTEMGNQRRFPGAPPERPATFKGYTFEGDAPLGVGGAGEVWRGKSTSGFDVAIKRLSLDDRSPMVQRERENLQLLKAIPRHPHVLYYLDFEEVGRDLFIVMELAKCSVDKVRGADGRIDPDLLLKFITDAADGLDYLHRGDERRGPIVHRDVKPANLLVVGDGVKVADFGLAREGIGGAVTHSGRLMSISYAAPEWFAGLKATPQSDQYCLAVSYAELRTGRHPFHRCQTNEALQRAISEGLFELDGLGLSEEEVVRKAMSRNPADRYPTCAAFAGALRGVLVSDHENEARRKATGSDRLRRLRECKVLRVGCYQYPPMMSYTGDARTGLRAAGYYVQLVEHAAAAAGMRVTFVPARSSRLRKLITGDLVDFIPCVFATNQRRMYADFTLPFQRIRLTGVIHRKGRSVTKQQDIWDQTVRVVIAREDVGFDFMIDHFDVEANEDGRFIVADTERLDDIMHMVGPGPGKYDVAIADALSCRVFCDENKRTHRQVFTNDPLQTFPVGVMVPKGDDEFKNWLMEKLLASRRDPSIAKEEDAILHEYSDVFIKVPTT